MTRRDYAYKWGLYGAALVLVILLETLLFTRFEVAGVYPVILPLAVAAGAVFEGAFGGSGFALAAGLLHSVFQYGDHPLLPVGLVLLSLICSVITARLKQGFLSFFLCSLVCLTAVSAGRAVEFASASPVSALLEVAVPEILYSLLYTVPVYLLFRAVYRRVGGTRLA